ncbi:hypothetical protein Taro_052908 [Colocasia esculenta]|uniref:Uncharacterized protein n=1 Tax=Colocasia esculenta TaxID=4460 RepID=A0A843XLF8_COLES|nr:hypothetical protein [Colocasia esculenta]
MTSVHRNGDDANKMLMPRQQHQGTRHRFPRRPQEHRYMPRPGDGLNGDPQSIVSLNHLKQRERQPSKKFEHSERQPSKHKMF